jgi:acetyl esterase/lipase
VVVELKVTRPSGLRRRAALALLALGAATVAVLGPQVSASAQGAIEVRSDITYATHAGDALLLDAYLPDAGAPVPGVIVVPGGKWVNIDKTKHSDVPTYFADHGIAAFAIEYRSATEFPYPAAVEDVVAAIRWVRGHAAEFDVDPTQLGAVGVSAGGHLAALAATMGSGPLDRGARVRVVASWSGPMDLEPLVDTPDADLREPVRTFLGCSATEDCTAVARDASPITYADPSDPPMFLVNGETEIIPVGQAESMARALAAAGVESEVDVVAGGGHGAGYGGGDKVLNQALPYIQSWIAGRPAPQVTGTQGTSGSGGKDSSAAAPTASPAPGKQTDPASKETGTGATATGSNETVVVAVAMVALLLVALELVVIVRLRRRVAALSAARTVEETGAS